MPYFLTDAEYDHGMMYETDASLELVKEWLAAKQEQLRLYFVSGYIRAGEIEFDGHVDAAQMAQDIGIATAKRAIRKAARETYLNTLTPEERYREENTLHVQNLDIILGRLEHFALFPPRS